MAVANGATSANFVSVLLGNGDGTFQAQATLAAQPAAKSLVVGDYNRDGIVDLVVGSDRLQAFFGNGNGTFNAGPTFAAGPAVTSLLAGDFDADGKLDLAAARGALDAVVFRGNGNGTFLGQQIFATDPMPDVLVAGDFDRDGLPDLAAAGARSKSVSLLANTLRTPHASGIDHFFLAAVPDVNTGDLVRFTVFALDACGTPVPNYAGTVTVTSTDPAAILPSSFTFGPADVSGHALALVFQSAGSHTLTITDTVNVALSGSASFQVSAPTGSHLIVSAPPTAFTGTPFGITVTAVDSSNQVMKNFTDTVQFVTLDTASGVQLPANYKFTAADQGIHTFNNAVVLQTLGLQFLEAVDADNGAVFGNTGILVTTPVPHFTVSAPPSVFAGLPFSITVTAQDASNQTMTGYTGTVHFAASDPAAGVLLPADYKFTAADQGVHTFSSGVLLQTVGTQTVVAIDTIDGSLNGSAAVLVNPAIPVHFVVSTPSAVTAGQPFDVTVTAADPSGNALPFYTGTVHFSSSDKSGLVQLPANYTFTSTDKGVHQFTAVALVTAGNQSIAVTDTFKPSITATVPIAVSAGPVAFLRVYAPAVAKVGTAFAVTVTASDAFNNPSSGYTGTVHFSLSDTSSGAGVPGDFTFTPSDGGTHTFPNAVVFGTLGTQFVTAVDTNQPLLAGTAPVTVQPTRPGPSGAPGIIVTGAEAGGGPNVVVFDAVTHATKFSFFAYDRRFTGGVRVAVGDVNGDGVPDIITAVGRGGGPDIHVYNGKTGSLLRQFFAYDPRFAGGVYVAAGDVNGDGYADVICGADAGGGPNITVFSGKDGTVIYSFFAYDPRFTGGVRVAAGDVNGDGFADIIAGAGPGGGPNVTVFSGVNRAVLQSYFAYDPRFSDGIYVAAGDVNRDGKADVITGAGAGGGPNVSIFSGVDGTVLHSLFPFNQAFAGGVRVAAIDTRGDGRVGVVAVMGPGGNPDVVTLDGVTPVTIDQFFAYDPRFTGGLYVAGSV